MNQNPKHGLLILTLVCGAGLAYCSAKGLHALGLELVPACIISMLVTSSASVCMVQYIRTRDFSYLILLMVCYPVLVLTDSLYSTEQVDLKAPDVDQEESRVVTLSEDLDFLRASLAASQAQDAGKKEDPAVLALQDSISLEKERLAKEIRTGDGKNCDGHRDEIARLQAELRTLTVGAGETLGSGDILEKLDQTRRELRESKDKAAQAREDRHFALKLADQVYPEKPKLVIQLLFVLIAGVAEFALLVLSKATSETLVPGVPEPEIALGTRKRGLDALISASDHEPNKSLLTRNAERCAGNLRDSIRGKRNGR